MEGVEGVKEIELELVDRFVVFSEVAFDELLQGLKQGGGTLAWSKQYSQPNTTKIAMRTTT